MQDQLPQEIEGVLKIFANNYPTAVPSFRKMLLRYLLTAKREEREKIIAELKLIEDQKWNDVDHCSCLRYAIDRIENPEADRTFYASKSTPTQEEE